MLSPADETQELPMQMYFHFRQVYPEHSVLALSVFLFLSGFLSLKGFDISDPVKSTFETDFVTALLIFSFCQTNLQ